MRHRHHAAARQLFEQGIQVHGAPRGVEHAAGAPDAHLRRGRQRGRGRGAGSERGGRGGYGSGRWGGGRAVAPSRGLAGPGLALATLRRGSGEAQARQEA